MLNISSQNSKFLFLDRLTVKRPLEVYLLVSLFTLISLNAISAQTWVDLNPFNQPPGNLLYSVSFVDEAYGWTVGERGFILHTADGGSTWQEQGQGVTEEDLLCVNFVNLQHGWTCGNSGIVISTEDGGQSWQQQETGRTENLLGVDFVDPQRGWVAGDGGILLNTTDGGVSWLPQNSGVEHRLTSLSFIDSSIGWTVGYLPGVLGSGIVLHTIDSGQTWPQQNGFERGPFSIDFTDINHGWMTCGNYIYRTTDGGESWQTSDFFYILFEIAAVSGEECWGVGSNAMIIHTSNGGESWEQQHDDDSPDSVTEHDLWGVCFIDDQTGWAVGKLGTILRTTDGGESWQLQRTRESIDMSTGIFVDAQKGWFVNSRVYQPARIWHSVDGGLSWQVQYEEEDVYFGSFFFADSLHGWVTGVEAESDQNKFLLRTTDSGNSWEKMLPPAISDWNSLFFFDSLVGFYGVCSAIYKTEDGGESWEAQTVPTEIDFRTGTIFFVDSLYGWLGGGYLFDAGVILNTIDGGSTWQVQEYTLPIVEIHFIDRNHGIATSNNPWVGRIYLTHDGGQTWTPQFDTGAWLRDCYLVDENNGWATGSNGYLFQTTDGGETWNKVDVGVQADLGAISFVEDNQIGYLFGDNSTLLRYELPPPVKGDINRDGSIDVLDVIRGVNIILGLPPLPTEYELWAGDLNEDDGVNVLDLVEIVNIILNDPTH